MTNIVELTLAALVGLASNFHAGVENLNNKSYDKAIIDFTAVIQSGASVAEMREQKKHADPEVRATVRELLKMN